MVINVIIVFHFMVFMQKYEMIKTEDIPHLENSTFSTRVVKDIAQNVLSFLKSNCTKEGHTYWLFKGGSWVNRNSLFLSCSKSVRYPTVLCACLSWSFLMFFLESTASGSDIVKLYDLTTLCEEAEEEKCQNPFTLPVAVLLYKWVCETDSGEQLHFWKPGKS